MRRIAALFFAALLAAFPAATQVIYPSHPITLISPDAPGGGTDFLGRVLADGMNTRLNQTVLVQNVGGAGSVVGSQQVAKAKPDGYTLLMNHIGMSTVPALYKKVAFDPLAAYEFIGLSRRGADDDPAPPGLPAPRISPSWSPTPRPSGTSSPSPPPAWAASTHLCALLFQQALGVPITVVQYKGGGPAVIDVRSGQVDAICDLPTTNSSADPLGRARGYLLTAPRRLASLPDVPTAAELGMPSLAIAVWFGLYAPIGTPKPVLDDAQQGAARRRGRTKPWRRSSKNIETVLPPLDQATPEAHRARVAAQIALWRPIIEKAGIQAE